MMPKNPQEFADLFSAKIVGEVPDTGAGPFGMARLAQIIQNRLTPSRGERPGRPTDPNWDKRAKVPMTKETHERLAELAKHMSTAERHVSPMQVAAQLLEEAMQRIGTPKAAVARAARQTDDENAEGEPERRLLPKDSKEPTLGEKTLGAKKN